MTEKEMYLSAPTTYELTTNQLNFMVEVAKTTIEVQSVQKQIIQSFSQSLNFSAIPKSSFPMLLNQMGNISTQDILDILLCIFTGEFKYNLSQVEYGVLWLITKETQYKEKLNFSNKSALKPLS